MAEQEAKRKGWFKAVAGTMLGLLSGAAGMYISPLINSVVKPSKPLANFAVETDGLTATFHNRYAGEGWWDFGDGTPLEPALPQQASISHTYAKPGTFPAKLMVRNFIGDEHERSVSLEVTVASATAAAPAISTFTAVPVGADRSAPATFRLLAQTTNAERLIWDLGGDRQPEVITEGTAKQEKFMTFGAPGDHTIQLVAVSGGQAVKHTEVVHVDAPKAGMLVARLRVTDRGTKSVVRTVTERVAITLTKSSTSTVPFDKTISAHNRSTITEAKAGEIDPAFRNVKLAIAADKRSLRITGELSPTKEMLASPNPPTIPILVTHSSQWTMNAPATEVTGTLGLPGSVTLPLPPAPADCAQPQRTVVLEIGGANGFVWQQAVPTTSYLDVGGRRYTVKAVPVGNDIKIDILPGGVGLTSTLK
jgi:PKD repeat protein